MIEATHKQQKQVPPKAPRIHSFSFFSICCVCVWGSVYLSHPPTRRLTRLRLCPCSTALMFPCSSSSTPSHVRSNPFSHAYPPPAVSSWSSTSIDQQWSLLKDIAVARTESNLTGFNATLWSHHLVSVRHSVVERFPLSWGGIITNNVEKLEVLVLKTSTKSVSTRTARQFFHSKCYYFCVVPVCATGICIIILLWW